MKFLFSPFNLSYVDFVIRPANKTIREEGKMFPSKNSKRVKVEAARPLRIQPQKCHFCWVLLAKVGQRLIRSNPDECPPLEGISRKVTLQRSESIWMIRIHEHRLQFISALAVYWVQVRNNSSVDLCVMFQQT